jgi:hypothetical protein
LGELFISHNLDGDYNAPLTECKGLAKDENDFSFPSLPILTKSNGASIVQLA